MKRVEESVDGQHVHVDGIMFLAQPTDPTDPKERIVKIGLGKDDENMAKEFAEHAMGDLQQMLQKQGFMPIRPRPFSDFVCFFLTKEHYNYMGRPTVDDYIDLNARIDKGR